MVAGPNSGIPLRASDVSISDWQRLWSKADTAKSERCWLWTGSTSRQGYGNFKMQGKSFQAHRVAILAKIGSLPRGAVVDHICQNRACINPDHLVVATQRSNARNRASTSGSGSLVRGVTWNRTYRKWQAKTYLNANGKRHLIWLGLHETKSDAERAMAGYWAVAQVGALRNVGRELLRDEDISPALDEHSRKEVDW